MSEPEETKPKKSSGRRRIIIWCRRFLIALVLLFVCNLIVQSYYRRANDRTIRDFYASVGATSMESILSINQPIDSSENGWHLFMASLDCLSKSTHEAVKSVKLSNIKEPLPALGSAVEAELDEGHSLLKKSRLRRYCVSRSQSKVRTYLRRLGDYARAAVLSARHHRKTGDSGKAKERLTDVFQLFQNSQGDPILITYLLGVGILRGVENEISSGLKQVPSGDLLLYQKLFNEIDLAQSFKLAIIGEVFFGIDALKAINNSMARGMGVYSLSGYELDRSWYLERIIPLALNPISSTIKTKLAEPIPLPFAMAFMSNSIGALLLQMIENQECAIMDLDIIQEGLSRELKRRQGGVFAYPPTNENIVLTKTKTGIRLQSRRSTPSPLVVEIAD